MANKWFVLRKSKEYGTEIFEYNSPNAQRAGADTLLLSCQNHRAVDTVMRHLIILPDPWKEGDGTREDFIALYDL